MWDHPTEYGVVGSLSINLYFYTSLLNMIKRRMRFLRWLNNLYKQLNNRLKKVFEVIELSLEPSTSGSIRLPPAYRLHYYYTLCRSGCLSVGVTSRMTEFESKNKKFGLVSNHSYFQRYQLY